MSPTRARARGDDARATRDDADDDDEDDDDDDATTTNAPRDDARARWSAVTIACACAAIGTVLAVASATTGGVEAVVRDGYAPRAGGEPGERSAETVRTRRSRGEARVGGDGRARGGW